MEDYVLTIPNADVKIMETLVARMGWKVRSKRKTIDEFISSCKKDVDMSDDDIQNEINAVRYSK